MELIEIMQLQGVFASIKVGAAVQNASVNKAIGNQQLPTTLHVLLFCRMQTYQQASRGVEASLAVKCDQGMQTEIHPVESHIDKKYEWNEWELRRKALKLVSADWVILAPCLIFISLL